MTDIQTETIKQNPWNAKDKANWLASQRTKRSYLEEVVAKIKLLEEKFNLQQYGELTFCAEKYPLYLLSSRNWNNNKPTVLVTGGVHGYETSGVHGAISFLENKALNYTDKFNLIVVPCVSPWGYETINRWNPDTIDPNRSFHENSLSEEASQLIQAVSAISTNLLAHIDLHETTDTDNSVFRPALAARDAVEQDNWNIPDGFYLVGDTDKPQIEFQQAIIESVERITHIAPSDENGKIIGVAISSTGIINYPTKKLGLCAGFTNAPYVTTTEVYPDSEQVSDEECNRAQVAAICGALNFLIDNNITLR